jgi:hypothetical protein
MVVSYTWAKEVIPIIRVVAKNRGYGKIYPVGSYARKKKMLNDLDFITNTPLPDDRKMISEKYKITNNTTGESKNVKVDIWYYKDINMGKFLRSYPRHVLIAVRTGLKKNNCSLTNVFRCKGVIVHNPSIRDIFNRANIKYRPLSYYYE